MSSTSFDPRAHRPVPGELAGRVIAITGAGDGIGRAVALDCARYGAQVVLIGRTVSKLEAVHAQIAAEGAPEASIAPLDLENALANDYDQLAHAVLERYGRLDGLLHNAGLLGQLAPIEHYDVPTWCRVMHVNVTAAFALTQVLMPALRRRFVRAGFPASTPDEAIRQSMRIVQRLPFADVRAAAAAVRCPTFLAWAEDDPLVEGAIGLELARELPDGPRLVFPDGGHNIQKTRAIELGRALSRFVLER